MIKWEPKSYKRPFIFLNLETFILLIVVLLLVIPYDSLILKADEHLNLLDTLNIGLSIDKNKSSHENS